MSTKKDRKQRERAANDERQEIIHRRKLFEGRMTAQEFHRANLVAAGHKCELCGGPPATEFRSIATVRDLKNESPQYLAAIQAQYKGVIPTFSTKFGPAVIISKVYACDLCTRTAEVAAAKGPSWIHVEISRGPGKDKPAVAVPS